MFRRLIHTTDDHLLTVLRLALGVVFLAHGAQKVLGWFGGHGFTATMGYFTQNMGIPAVFAVLAILAEFLGGLGLIFGFLSRIAGLGIAMEMLVAVFLVHLPNGLFMNWAGNQKGEGFEYHLLAISIAAMLTVRGAGAVSLDRALDRGLARSRVTAMHTPHPQPSRG